MIKDGLRTGKIEIDTQKIDDVQWIVATIQNVKIESSDGSLVSEHFRDGKIFRKVADVALETVTITDPVTGVTMTLSVAGMGTAIKAMMIKWILEDNPNSSYDNKLGMVVKNG